MKIGLLSYPMLFQNMGGLQIQILETAAALRRLGVEARLVDPVRERLMDYDLIHVFSAINGNHRIVECAKEQGLPVVVSPLAQPHWTAPLGWVARRLESAVGRLTGWIIKTEYHAIASCLRQANALIALGDAERSAIVDAFRIPAERIRVVPNGIPPRFFLADPRPFSEHYEIERGFVLSVASVNEYKNQLTLARALHGTGRRLVLVGPCGAANRDYVDRLVALPNVAYLGALDYNDPLLASAYAAAGVFCLPSLSEVMPLSAMESLAAGTPVVMTKNHCMNLSGMRSFVKEVSPRDETAIRGAVEQLAEARIDRESCSATVARFSWDAVAAEIALCYQETLDLATHRTERRHNGRQPSDPPRGRQGPEERSLAPVGPSARVPGNQHY